MNQQGLLDQMNFIPPANPNGGQVAQQDYRRMQDPMIVDNRADNYFQGQGVRIG